MSEGLEGISLEGLEGIGDDFLQSMDNLDPRKNAMVAKRAFETRPDETNEQAMREIVDQEEYTHKWERKRAEKAWTKALGALQTDFPNEPAFRVWYTLHMTTKKRVKASPKKSEPQALELTAATTTTPLVLESYPFHILQAICASLGAADTFCLVQTNRRFNELLTDEFNQHIWLSSFAQLNTAINSGVTRTVEEILDSMEGPAPPQKQHNGGLCIAMRKTGGCMGLVRLSPASNTDIQQLHVAFDKGKLKSVNAAAIFAGFRRSLEHYRKAVSKYAQDIGRYAGGSGCAYSQDEVPSIPRLSASNACPFSAIQIENLDVYSQGGSGCVKRTGNKFSASLHILRLPHTLREAWLAMELGKDDATVRCVLPELLALIAKEEEILSFWTLNTRHDTHEESVLLHKASCILVATALRLGLDLLVPAAPAKSVINDPVLWRGVRACMRLLPVRWMQPEEAGDELSSLTCCESELSEPVYHVVRQRVARLLNTRRSVGIELCLRLLEDDPCSFARWSTCWTDGREETTTHGPDRCVVIEDEEVEIVPRVLVHNPFYPSYEENRECVPLRSAPLGAAMRFALADECADVCDNNGTGGTLKTRFIDGTRGRNDLLNDDHTYDVCGCLLRCLRSVAKDDRRAVFGQLKKQGRHLLRSDTLHMAFSLSPTSNDQWFCNLRRDAISQLLKRWQLEFCSHCTDRKRKRGDNDAPPPTLPDCPVEEAGGPSCEICEDLREENQSRCPITGRMW
jgi:hypothetical protein